MTPPAAGRTLSDTALSVDEKVPNHCWHTDATSFSYGTRRNAGQTCCWCGARRTQITTMGQVMGHGPYGEPLTKAQVRYEAASDVPERCDKAASGDRPQ